MRYEEEVVTVKEIAKRLKVSEKTVKRWIHDGKLPRAIMLSKKGGYRIPKSDVESMMEQGQVFKPSVEDEHTDAQK